MLMAERDSAPSKSPLIAAITNLSRERAALNERGLLPGAPSPATTSLLRSPRRTPWRTNLEDSICACIPNRVKRANMGDRLNSIERAAGPMDGIVIPRITAACHSVAALGQDAVCSFIDAMWMVAVRARKEYPDSSGDSGLEARTNFICGSVDKLVAISARVSNERAFCLVCTGIERIKDFRVMSKYINYMHSASGEVRPYNPKGVFKSPEPLAFQARFLSERTEGAAPEYIDSILTKFIAKLNELSAETP